MRKTPNASQLQRREGKEEVASEENGQATITLPDVAAVLGWKGRRMREERGGDGSTQQLAQ
jgi:hypothetical protein